MTTDGGRRAGRRNVHDTAYDVVIIGAGPSGAAASRLLAAWGYAVLVVAKPRAAHGSLAVSLPPSCAKPLAAVGLDHAFRDARFLETRGNTVWWGAGEPSSRAFSVEPV